MVGSGRDAGVRRGVRSFPIEMKRAPVSTCDDDDGDDDHVLSLGRLCADHDVMMI